MDKVKPYAEDTHEEKAELSQSHLTGEGNRSESDVASNVTDEGETVIARWKTSDAEPALSVADQSAEDQVKNLLAGTDEFDLSYTEEAKLLESTTVDVVVDAVSFFSVGHESEGDAFKERLRKIQSNTDSHLTSDVTFTDEQLKIPENIQEALVIDMRLERPSRIQQVTLPNIIEGYNLIAQAQSGSGKTLAFSIGMLCQIDPNARHLQALCLTPTRELAIQILSEAIIPLKRHITPDIICEAGIQGINYSRGARSGAQLVVGTPGKTMSWITQRYIDTSRLKIFVVDEADAMVINSDSATFPPEVLQFAKTIVPNAISVRLQNTEDLVLSEIFQVWIDTTKAEGGKLEVLSEIYNKLPMQQSVVFVERRVDADRIADMMTTSGYQVSTLHSELGGPARDEVMETFRRQRSRVLITTNVLARGVDVESIAVVINFDLPVTRGARGAPPTPDFVTYLHRIGRTGRFGRHGLAINLVSSMEEMRIVQMIEQYYTSSTTDRSWGVEEEWVKPDGPSRLIHEWDFTNIGGLSAHLKY